MSQTLREIRNVFQVSLGVYRELALSASQLLPRRR